MLGPLKIWKSNLTLPLVDTLAKATTATHTLRVVCSNILGSQLSPYVVKGTRLL